MNKDQIEFVAKALAAVIQGYSDTRLTADDIRALAREAILAVGEWRYLQRS